MKTKTVCKAFMDKIGRGIETEAVRADLRNIYFKHIGLARVMGDDRSYTQLADELFEGIELVITKSSRWSFTRQHLDVC